VIELETVTAMLKSRLRSRPILLAPGVCDPLTALVAAQAGAEALYLSGASIAYTRLGRPVDLPLIVDADNGYGNALNMQRTMRQFERAGASALQIEDQSYPKRCGHLQEKRLISTAEMTGKIKAAADVRASEATLIVARTDAIAVEGFDAAIARAQAYAGAGADALFVEAPGSLEELTRLPLALGGALPLVANMVEGGRTPVTSAAELERLGFALVIFPGGIVRAMALAAQEFYATLLKDGTSDAFRNRMFDFDGLNAVIGTPAMLADGKRYEGDA
jgi:2-methylisocitrate lyase-like PEP mutase family enzyme